MSKWCIRQVVTTNDWRLKLCLREVKIRLGAEPLQGGLAPCSPALAATWASISSLNLPDAPLSKWSRCRTISGCRARRRGRRSGRHRSGRGHGAASLLVACAARIARLCPGHGRRATRLPRRRIRRRTLRLRRHVLPRPGRGAERISTCTQAGWTSRRLHVAGIAGRGPQHCPGRAGPWGGGTLRAGSPNPMTWRGYWSGPASRTSGW